MDLFGYIIGALLAKIFGVAGFLGLASGFLNTKWYMAVFFGLLAGIIDYFVLAEVNPVLSMQPEALVTSLIAALIVGGAFAFLGWKMRQRMSKIRNRRKDQEMGQGS